MLTERHAAELEASGRMTDTLAALTGHTSLSEV